MNINQPGAHIDHMLRQTRMHNMQLSSMADMKANMLLTASSIVLGLVLAHIGVGSLTIPLAVLAASCVMTIALSTYATMPKVKSTSSTSAQATKSNPHFTLLFFGDYTTLSLEEYEAEMEAVMNDPSLTYQAQVREMYHMGCYLKKSKFFKLRLAYFSFLTGVIVSLLLAIVSAS